MVGSARLKSGTKWYIAVKAIYRTKLEGNVQRTTSDKETADFLGGWPAKEGAYIATGVENTRRCV